MTDLREKALAVLYALVIAGYPLVAALPSLFGFSSRFVSVPLRATIVAASLVILVTTAALNTKLFFGPLCFPLFLFWGLYWTRLVMDTAVQQVAVILQPGYDWLFALGTCLLPMLPFFTRQDEILLARARRWGLVACLAACLSALAASGAEFELGSGYLAGQGRAGFATLNPVSMGNLGVTTAILGLAGLLTRKDDRRWVKAAGIVAVLLGTATSVLAASRGPMLSLVFAGVLLLIAWLRHARRTVAPVFGLIVVIAVILRVAGSSLLLRFQALTLSAMDPSVGIHLDLLRDGWNQFVSSPLLGSGVVEENTGFYPHNIVVEAYMATGIVGGTALLVALVGGAWLALRLALSNGERQWVALLYFQYLFAAMLSGAVIGSGTMWCLLAAVIATYHFMRYRSREHADRRPHLGAVSEETVRQRRSD
jgi:O-antigen ligase